MVRVRIRTPCRETESLAKVKIAILNLFPDAVFSREDDEVEAEAASLERFREKVRSQKIRDSARGALLHGVTGSRVRISLNKQAAYAGRVSFGADSPLGDLEVEFEGDEPEALIDGIAESTTRPPPPPLS